MSTDWHPSSGESQPCGRELTGLVGEQAAGGAVRPREVVLACCDLQTGHSGPHDGLMFDSDQRVVWQRGMTRLRFPEGRL